MVQKYVFLFFMSSSVFGQMSMRGSGPDGIREGSISSLVSSQVDRADVSENSSTRSVRPNNVARTLPIRINLLSDLGGWNTDLQELEVPELEWELNRGDSETMTFEQAEAYAADRSADGWRLPTLWELEALYRQSEVLNRDLSDDFNNEYLLVNAFWSSTEVEGRSTHIWHIDFGLGLNDEERVDHSFHELELRVRLVRSREA